MQEYSKRLGKISPEQFQAALSRFDLGEFVRAEPVSFGLFGQNVFLTSTQGEFVLRGVPHYPWQFPTERYFADRLHERTQTPVPHPYLLESTTDIFGWSFVIMPRLAGLQLQDEKIYARLSSDDRLEVARALARNLVEVEKLTWDFSGSYDPETDSVKPFDRPYQKWVLSNIREKVTNSLSYNDHTTASDLHWIESVIAGAAPVMDLPFQACTVHSDYGEHNAVVLQTRSGWRVSGLFDLMTAHMGDGLADLSVQVTAYIRKDEALADAYVNEYLRLKPRRPGFALLEKLYMLDLNLSFWRHWQRNEGGIPGEPKGLTFEQYARPSVDYWQKFPA